MRQLAASPPGGHARGTHRNPAAHVKIVRFLLTEGVGENISNVAPQGTDPDALTELNWSQRLALGIGEEKIILKNPNNNQFWVK